MNKNCLSSISLFLLLFVSQFLPANAQNDLNTFLRSKSSLRYAKSIGSDTYFEINNVSASRDGSTLYIRFDEPPHSVFPLYKYTLMIDLRNTSIYNGSWRKSQDQYGRTKYIQEGDKSTVYFRGTVKYFFEVPSYSSNKREINSFPSLKINCNSSHDADRLVSLILDAQKGYREPDPWAKESNASATIANNPYSGMTSSEIFNKIKWYFNEYEVLAVLGYTVKAPINNPKVTFVYPDLTFSFTTKQNVSKYVISESVFGNTELCCPVGSTTIENNNGTIVFTSPQGLVYTINGSKTIIGDYGFQVSSFISEDLTSAIQQFFKAILNEGYRGSYGMITPKSSTSVNTQQTTSTSKSATSSGKQDSILPSDEEIATTNSRLPILVSEGTMWTKVEYDKNTKVQRFYYRFTENVDSQAISVAQKQGKERVKNALRQNSQSMSRVNAGMTYLYIYYSKDNKKLYEIRINKSDF